MKRILSLLDVNKVRQVAIFSHISADGDCLGAQCAIGRIISKKGYIVRMYNQSPIAENLMFIPDSGCVHPFEEDERLPDICIAVDCADYRRMGNLPEKLKSCGWINIDHHVSNTRFGMYNFVQEDVSSTCEIITEMAVHSDLEIDSNTATALYTGISTDTGSFMFSNVTASTFRFAALLLEKGADASLVRNHFYEHTSRKQLEIYSYLYDNIIFLYNDAVAYCVFPQEVITELGVEKRDFDGVISMIRNIAGVELAILFIETDGQVKISMRSREWFNANTCCNQLGGGGHVRASGATIDKPLEEAVSDTFLAVKNEWEKRH